MSTRRPTLARHGGKLIPQSSAITLYITEASGKNLPPDGVTTAEVMAVCMNAEDFWNE